MNEIILLIIGIGLFFFGYEIRPWIVIKYPETRHLIDLIVMVISITTILINLISLITSGTVVLGIYLVISPIFAGYLIYYGWKHKEELNGKSRKIWGVFIAMYAYIFSASCVLIILLAPFMPNIKL